MRITHSRWRNASAESETRQRVARCRCVNGQVRGQRPLGRDVEIGRRDVGIRVRLDAVAGLLCSKPWNLTDVQGLADPTGSRISKNHGCYAVMEYHVMFA